jgi:cytoskeletal protein RodZ
MSIIESANGVGARLAQARTERGLSVEDLSSRTYIRPAVIRGIENDDFAACGGPFYARGHVRTIARTLGIDESPLLQEFDRSNGGAPEPRIAPESGTAEPVSLRAQRPRSSGPGWTAVATVVLVVICVIILIGLLVGGPSKNDNSASAPAPKRTSASKAPAKTPANPPPARPASGVNLQVRVTDSASWVRVVDATGRELVATVQQPGAVNQYQSPQQLRFTFGNAGAVQATCNGNSLGQLGGQGQVVTRVLTLSDPACASQGG